MVKRYSLDGSNCDSYYGCSAKMTECDKGGAFVLATDYAALEAERDEWKRRVDNILVAVAKEEGGNNHDFHPCNFVCREIRSIAERRE